MQWDRNSRGCLDAITNYHRVSSRSKYTGEARTKSCVPIGIILVIGFVVSRNIHRCAVRLPTPLVFVRDKTVTIRSLVSNYETASCFIFIFDSKEGEGNFSRGNIKVTTASIDFDHLSYPEGKQERSRRINFKIGEMRIKILLLNTSSRSESRMLEIFLHGIVLNPLIPLTYSIGWNGKPQIVCTVS